MSTYTPGRFVWHELMTPDVEKAKGFYAELFGWTFQSMPMPGMDYTIIQNAGAGIGGVMPLSAVPMPGVPPHWLGYVSADADAAAAATRKAGGNVLGEPFDVPDVGRIAILQDATGAAWATYRGLKGDEPEVERPAAGTFCWDQLNTTDPSKAAAFYASTLGWTTRPFHDSKDLSVFMREGGRETASLMSAPPGVPSHWLTYVLVGKLADARGRAVRMGAQVHLEHLPVQGIGTISVIGDPAGAAIGLFEPER